MRLSLCSQPRGWIRTYPLVRECNRRVRVIRRSSEGYINIGDGDMIALPKKREELWPSYEFSKEEAVSLQLEALKNNNKPYPDHGVEVMYRFANFDPFIRSTYFGRSFDLGQFERFRRIMHTPSYCPLLSHESWTMMSCLQLSERAWRVRLSVQGFKSKEECFYEMTLVQRLGGVYDGYWFTESLVRDGDEWPTVKVTW